MAQNCEPPSFISETKTYAEYKEDLERWSRLSSLDKKLQAEMVVHRLDGHPSRIKEKIVTKIGTSLIDNAEGIKELIKFLDSVYGVDEMANVWERYQAFSSHARKPNQDISDFIPDWEMCYQKLKTSGCDYPDTILGLKLLEDAKLSDMDVKLVLTGVDYTKAKTDKDLQQQITNSLKKFTGRSVISNKQDNLAVSVKSEPTWISEVEEVLLARGWKQPQKGRRRSRSESPPRSRPSSNYKGKKNNLGLNGKPKKCYLCKCEHVDNCNCPCVYHLADKCPQRKARVTGVEKPKPDFGLFMNSSVFYTTDDVLIVGEKLDNLVLLTVSTRDAVVDCACPTTVAGEAWVQGFIESLDNDSKTLVQHYSSERTFKFGGGEKRVSLGVVVLPCRLAGKNLMIKTEVVRADFPLLLGNSMLKKVGAVLYIKEQKAVILDTEVIMKEAGSGHFMLQIEPPLGGAEFFKFVGQSEESVSNCLVTMDRDLTYQDIQKLHHTFGHVASSKLEKLIRNAKKLTEEVEGFLKKVEETCQSCQKNRIMKPRPAVSLPRVSQFNQIVSIDLKQYTDGLDKYILYMVDLFSRLTVGALIKNKKPATIGEMILEKWISVMGRMDMIHSDRGGEFCCEELVDIAEFLNVRSSFTAAHSPYQNGTNERNHAVVDRMIVKMCAHDPSLSVKVALTWALVAKNSLENVSGFSPFQLVFGKAPALPSVYTSGPPGYEEVAMEKAVADHINAMFLAREAYMQGESDRVLKAALKQRIYRRGEDVRANEWIYFNNKGKWEGPVKVTTKDGKNLYVVRGGRLLTINTDHAQLALFDGELKEHSHKVQNSDKTENIPNIPKTTEQCNLDLDASVNNSSNKALPDISESEQNSIGVDSQELSKDDSSNTTGVSSIPVEVKKHEIVQYRKSGESEWIEGKVLGRAGKRGGKYDSWWNVKNVETGHVEAIDLEKDVDELKKVVANETGDDQVYVVQIPRHRHSEERCRIAKEKELDCWDKYAVYEEVEDLGQTRIGTNWVLTEKNADDQRTVKARLTVRGDQEETDGVRKDSPTVRKGNIKIFSTIAAIEKWDIKTSDVSSAFLQGIEIDRDVFVLPPKERRVPGVLWRLLKPVYGLVDAPRGWYCALDDEFMRSGCEKCLFDPAMYIYFVCEKGQKSLKGLALTHVDDFLHGGEKIFDDNVMSSIKSAFEFGLEQSEKFRYVGMNMSQVGCGITIDQDHYVKGLEVPDMEIAHDLAITDILPAEGQSIFRGAVAKILHISYQSRPDVCFEAKCLSTKFGKATKGDLKAALKKMQKLQGIATRMVFPDLGAVSDWTFVGYGDAGIKSMPDKLGSCGGQVVLIANNRLGAGCVLNWRSKKLTRVVVSSLAGEALALVAAIGEMVYTKAIFKQIYGEIIDSVPVVVYTDSRNLYEAINSTTLVDDAWLIPDIAVIKEALCQKTITCVRRVKSEDMLANCLTKAGVSAEQLMKVLQTGRYVMPSCLEMKGEGCELVTER